MKAIELQLLITEHNACQHAWKWDPIARKKIRAGEICVSCRRALPQPHTPESKLCVCCSARHHVRMTFNLFHEWYCRFYTMRWQPLPRRLCFREAASIIETARRGDGLIDAATTDALERSLKIGRGGIVLRLTEEQFQEIGGVPAATRNAPDGPGAHAEDISPNA